MMSMTSETRTYIDVNDLLAAVVQCPGCHASLALSFAADHMNLPQNCPHCRAQWFESTPQNPTRGQRLSALFEALRLLKSSLDSKAEPTKFTFRLEIAQPRKEQP
jgi:hypothetical protein